ncbi:MAG TPA: nucleotide exchange factor GrpE [Candidatus Paceibacterota bacterium]
MEKNNQQEKNEIQELNKKLENCQKERDEYLNGWKRAKADLINDQKDEAKRFEELLKFGSADLIKDFIPVLNNFDLALSVLEKDGKAEKGVYMIRTQLEDVLRKRGLEKMAVSAGNNFDPSLHEAIGEIESEHQAGTVALIIENGYTLNGRVIRPARVKLAKGKTSN